MKALTTWLGVPILLLSGLSLTGCNENPVSEDALGTTQLVSVSDASAESFEVSGGAIHYFTRAIIHSQEQTETGMIQRSSDYIELNGDLKGYVLYHPVSVFDFAGGTLVNTGTQLFSGTVAGSAPVILYDDTFRFEVDLNSGATTGEVHLRRSKDNPEKGGWYECDLVIVGTGMTPEGDGVSEYTGTCTARGNLN